MTDHGTESSRARGGSSRRGWVHFGIAAGTLLAFALSFQVTEDALSLAIDKDPVPWPDGVVVDPETFRLRSFPDVVGGRYYLLEDGTMSDEEDGRPDGEIVIPETVMELLNIGTGLDKRRVESRRSNWYTSRAYRDARRPDGDPLKYWRIDVYYYTGGMDTVPHVPEICSTAAGAESLGSENVTLHLPPDPEYPQWSGDLDVRRVRFRLNDPRVGTRRMSEYYVFSINGEPTTSREMVRLKLLDLRRSYSYFAKIQFSPMLAGASDEQTDEAAEDLMQHFTPAIAATLPDRERLKALEAAE